MSNSIWSQVKCTVTYSGRSLGIGRSARALIAILSIGLTVHWAVAKLLKTRPQLLLIGITDERTLRYLPSLGHSVILTVYC